MKKYLAFLLLALILTALSLWVGINYPLPEGGKADLVQLFGAGAGLAAIIGWGAAFNYASEIKD